VNTPHSFPVWIAHRGAGKLAPENTLAAFRLGASHGYRAFECDVKLSADGAPFLLHDATLDRTTSGVGVGSEKTWAELSRLDAGRWHSNTYAGEPLPRLDAIASYCIRNDFMLNIEIKPTPGDEVQTGRVVAATAAGLWVQHADKPLLSSFSADALAASKDAAPNLPRALLLDKLPSEWFATAQGLGCSAVVTHFSLMDAAVIKHLHDAGMRAMVYTVNDANEAQRLLELGVDGIITDAVDKFDPRKRAVPV
jgi:glycerophosphoryl diester phosphodiesterase